MLMQKSDGFPVSYVWDITSLEAPKNTGYYKSSTRSVDHNQFVHEGLAYQSNYQAGLRILDVSSLSKFPDASKVEEIAYFDVFPQDDGKLTYPTPMTTMSNLGTDNHHRTSRQGLGSLGLWHLEPLHVPVRLHCDQHD